MEKLNRDNTFDIARGIAILGMIYGHAVAQMNYHDWMCDWFWSFHMPMFALVAGYFYKEKPFLRTFWSSIKTLLLPCLAISLFLLLSDEILGGVNNCKSLLCEWVYRTFLVFTLQYAPCGFWFVSALFSARMIFALTSVLKYRYTNIILATISLFVVFCLPHIETCQFTPTFSLLIFMIIGMYARKYDIINIPVNRIANIALLGILIAARWLYVGVVVSDYPMGVFNIVTASAICYAIIHYSQILDHLECRAVKSLNELLAYSGRHSMILLFIQGVFIYAHRYVNYVSAYTGITNPYVMMVLFMLTCLACTYIINQITIKIWIYLKSIL